MKKLERQEMKNLKGGDYSGGGGFGCSTTIYCGKWTGGASGHWEAGTCSVEPGLPGLPGICTCDKTSSSEQCSTA